MAPPRPAQGLRRLRARLVLGGPREPLPLASRLGAALLRQLHQAEVEDLGLALGVDHDVAGLEVAVDQAAAVGGEQAPGDLQEHLQDLPQGARARGQPPVEDLAGHVLEREIVGVPIGHATLVELDHVGVVEAGERVGLAVEPGSLVVAGEADHLEGDRSAHASIGGQVHLAEAPLADEPTGLDVGGGELRLRLEEPAAHGFDALPALGDRAVSQQRVDVHRRWGPLWCCPSAAPISELAREWGADADPAVRDGGVSCAESWAELEPRRSTTTADPGAPHTAL